MPNAAILKMPFAGKARLWSCPREKTQRYYALASNCIRPVNLIVMGSWFQPIFPLPERNLRVHSFRATDASCCLWATSFRQDRPMSDHDQRFKIVLQTFFAEFFRLFFPAWAEHFDFSQIEWLDK